MYDIKVENDLECSPSIPSFFGAVFRKYRFISTYYILLCFATGFQFAAGIWYLVTFYRTRNQTFNQCVNGSTDPTRISYCNSLKVYKTIPQEYVIAQAIVPLLIQLCKFLNCFCCKWCSHLCFKDACYIVNRYARYLDAEKTRGHAPFIQVAPVYQRVNPHDESYPLAHPNVTYPYADNSHSFGHKV